MTVPTKQNLRNAKAVVTGGSGFIGSNLVEHLRKSNCEVINLDKLPPRNPLHTGLWRQADLLDRPLIMQTVQSFDPQYIFHLGARTDLLSTKQSDYSANTVGLGNIIAACDSLKNLKRVLFASSRLVCRIGYQPRGPDDYCPTTAYGESKVIGEEIIKKHGATAYEWCIVRPTSIWGPWFGIPYRNFFDHVLHGRYIHPKGLRISKSFGFVGNSVYQLERLMLACRGRVNSNVFYLGDYSPIDVYDFASDIAKESGARVVKEMPLPVMKFLALTGDAIQRLGFGEMPLTTFRLANLCANMVHDFEKLPEITGELPYTTKEGIEETVKWMREMR